MAKNIVAKNDVVKRMKSAEGHLRGVIKLIEDDAYCMEIINQNHAVIEALKKVNHLVLEGYLGECAWNAMTAKEANKRKAAIQELVKLYSKK
jgi:DNA-binding FrmR family transcriptional regulator